MERRQPRIPAAHALLVRTIADRPTERFAKTQNVGLGGCLFVSDTGMGVGTALHLLLAADGHVITAAALVVHETPREDGTFRVGTAFVGIPETDRQRLGHFVSSRYQEAVTSLARVAPRSPLVPCSAPASDDEQASRRFLALLGRELRPSLQALVRASRQSLRSPLFPEEAERLRMVQDVARYLLGLANRLRGENSAAGTDTYPRSGLFDPRAALGTALALVRPKARAAGVWIQEDVEATVPRSLTGSGASFRELFAEVLSVGVRSPADSRLIAALGWSDSNLVFWLGPTGSSSRARPFPRRTVPGRRLAELAGGLGAQIEIDIGEDGHPRISVQVPAPATRPPGGEGAPKPSGRPLCAKGGRNLVILPSRQGFGTSGARYEQLAASRLTWYFGRRVVDSRPSQAG